MKARYLLFLLLVMATVHKLRANDANWDYNPYAFQYDMSVYVELSTIDENNIANEDFQKTYENFIKFLIMLKSE